jgi:uncharacterized protein involved in exopolysaccharide biosynthesis
MNIAEKEGMPEKSAYRLDIFRILQTAFQHWTGILTFALAGMLSAGLYTAFATPIYSATAILMPPPGASNDAVLNQLKSFAKSSTSLPLVSDPQIRFDLFQALLTTDTMGRRMLDNYNFKYEIFEQSWDTQRKVWRKNLPLIPATIDFIMELTGYSYWQPPDASQMRKYISKHLSQSTDLTSGMLQLEFTSRNPKLTSAFLSALIGQTDAVIRQSDVSTLRAVIADLEKRLPAITVQSQLDAMISTVNDLRLQLSQATVGQAYSMTLIQPPIDNDNVVWPRPLLLLAAGGFLGLILGVVLAVFDLIPSLNWLIQRRKSDGSGELEQGPRSTSTIIR